MANESPGAHRAKRSGERIIETASLSKNTVGELHPDEAPRMATNHRPRSKRGRKPRPPANVLAEVRRQAAGHRTARRQNAAETAEDYVELIDDLIREHGEARAVDLANRLGVSHVTVTKTIQRLQREGLVRTEPYRAIFLQPQGRKLAEVCRARHELVVNFLKAIGVDEATAQQDAEGIEHHVSEATLAAMAAMVKGKSSLGG